VAETISGAHFFWRAAPVRSPCTTTKYKMPKDNTKGEKKEKKEKAPKDPNAPKKPLSGYMFFSKAQRDAIKAANPEASFGT
jgi:structure-specific recognition protein 1